MRKRWVLGCACLLAALSFWACDKGYAVAIGLNAVDPNHYNGWTGKLGGCEPDALMMADIAEAQRFKSVDVFLTANATRKAILDDLDALALKLKSGDLLVVSYSGHGGQIPDINGDETDDHLDETWCLYDGELLDDELSEAWSKFKPDVRILVFSDSCHSGTVLKMIRTDFDPQGPIRTDELNQNLKEAYELRNLFKKDNIRETLKRDTAFRSKIRDISPQLKAMPRAPEIADIEVDAVIENSVPRVVPWQVIKGTYDKNRSFYDNLGSRTFANRDGTPVRTEDGIQIEASVILISGCQDRQFSIDLGGNGLFTSMLYQVWNNGDFAGSHTDFHTAIRDKVTAFNPNQAPNFFMAGRSNPPFVQQKPYTADKPN